MLDERQHRNYNSWNGKSLLSIQKAFKILSSKLFRNILEIGSSNIWKTWERNTDFMQKIEIGVDYGWQHYVKNDTGIGLELLVSMVCILFWWYVGNIYSELAVKCNYNEQQQFNIASSARILSEYLSDSIFYLVLVKGNNQSKYIFLPGSNCSQPLLFVIH